MYCMYIIPMYMVHFDDISGESGFDSSEGALLGMTPCSRIDPYDLVVRFSVLNPVYKGEVLLPHLFDDFLYLSLCF